MTVRLASCFLLGFLPAVLIVISFIFKIFIFGCAPPCGSAGKESACNVGDLGLILELGRSPGEGKDYPLQYSDLENSMGCIVHGVASLTQ